jgi:nitronate monooxygenase
MSIPNLKIPILQAPIGSCTGPELAAAVSRAGGLGALALTWASPEASRKQIAQVKALTDKPFQANFVLSFEPNSLSACLEAGVAVVTFSWGIPTKHSRLVKSFGVLMGVQVSTADGAQRAVDAGADFLIAQGLEAGGHVQATQSLRVVLPSVLRRAGGVPVIAAGGLATGADVAAIMREGAAGAMLGTRSVATTESLAHAQYKKQLVDASGTDTALTVCFDIGWPYAAHRVLRNGTLETWESSGCLPSGARPGEGDILSRIDQRAILRYEDTPPLIGMQGDVTQMCLYAGTGVGAVNDLPSAEELVARLWRECQDRSAHC